MLWSYLFEVSKIEKFLVFIFFFLILLSIFRIVFVDLFFNRFYFFYFLIFILVFLNFCICSSVDLVFILMVLIILSFFSLFSVIIGFGFSIEVCFIIPFKLLADFFLILYLGFFFFLIGEWEILIWINFYNCFFFGNFFLFLSFLIYSFCGIFGFWIYWAMEGSYFISSYLHSVGFILISVIIFFKMFYLGLLESYFFFIYKLEVFFFFSFIFFLLCFLVVKKIKKSFGYFSCSGVCFIFLIFLNSPSIGLIYFLFSSFIKIIFFEIMGSFYKFFILKDLTFKRKSNFFLKEDFNFIYFYILIIFSVFSIFFLIYSEVFYLYFCLDIFLDFYFFNGFFSKIVYFLLFFKFFGILSFLFKLNLIFFKSFFFYFEVFRKKCFWFINENNLVNEIKLEIIIICFFFFGFYGFFCISFFEWKLQIHFLNFFFWFLFFCFYFFDFYKFFFIFILENNVRFFLFKFYNVIFNDNSFLKFTFEKKKLVLKENKIIFLIGISYCFFCISFLV